MRRNGRGRWCTHRMPTTFAITCSARSSKTHRSRARLAAKVRTARIAKPRLSSETHALADSLKDVDTPGRYRKVGPSLRHLDSKVDFAWLYSWIRKPADFRPSTRMPQFFGHFQHLEAKVPEFTVTDAQGNEHQITDKEYTARFEGVEVRALSEFLLANSQPFEYLDPPQGVTEAAVGRTRQVAVRIAWLPGLPFARRFPEYPFDARS